MGGGVLRRDSMRIVLDGGKAIALETGRSGLGLGFRLILGLGQRFPDRCRGLRTTKIVSRGMSGAVELVTSSDSAVLPFTLNSKSKLTWKVG